MTFIFPESQRFDCGSCTKCCRGAWNVHVDPSSFEKVVGSPLYRELEEKHGTAPMFVDELEPGHKTALTLMDNGRCVFLDENRLCSIHRDMGEKAKPMGCRQFPFILRPTPDGVVVGVSFFCSAVQANSGRPLKEHAEELEGLLKEYRYAQVGFRPVPLHADVTLSWAAYQVLEQTAVACLQADDMRTALWTVMLGTALATVYLMRGGINSGMVSALEPTVSDEEANRRLSTMKPLLVCRDDVMESLERMFLIGIVGALESPNPTICKANTDAIFSRKIIDSEIFRCDIDLGHFDDFRTRFDARWSEPHFRRYVDHLVFRKFLGVGRTMVANATALYMAVPLLEWYRDMSAYVQNKLQPDLHDVNLAFDVVERGFTTHTRAMDPFFMQMADSFVGQLEKLVEASDGRV